MALNAPSLASAQQTVVELDKIKAGVDQAAFAAAYLSAANTATLVGAVTDLPPAVKNAQFYGAKGDGKADDTAALQKMADACGVSGLPFVIDKPGTYMVRASGVEFTKPGGTIRLSKVPGVILKTIPHNQDRAYIFRFRSTAVGSNVDLGAARFVGDRYEHTYAPGSTHEHGYGIFVAGSSVQLYSSNVDITRSLLDQDTSLLANVSNCTGDGIGITGPSHKVCGIVCDGNRRQGLSAFNPSGVEISYSIFQNTGNLLKPEPAGLIGPFCGMDVEPDVGDALGLRVHHCIFRANQKSGFIAWLRKEVLGKITGEFTDNVVVGNVNGLWFKDATESRAKTITFKVLRNLFINQSALGIRADFGCDLVVDGNTFDRTGDRPDAPKANIGSPDLGRYGNAVVSAPRNFVV